MSSAGVNPVPDLVGVVMALGSRASEERLTKAWQMATNELGATPDEIASFACWAATSCDKPPTPRDFAVWLAERRKRDRLAMMGDLVHAYDENGFEWLIPRSELDGVRYIGDDERRRRRPWRNA